MILIIDNYDSFTYNLVDIVSKHQNVIVKYPDDPDALTYQETVSGVIISPGPGHPLDKNNRNIQKFTNIRRLFRRTSVDLLLRWSSNPI